MELLEHSWFFFFFLNWRVCSQVNIYVYYVFRVRNWRWTMLGLILIIRVNELEIERERENNLFTVSLVLLNWFTLWISCADLLSLWSLFLVFLGFLILKKIQILMNLGMLGIYKVSLLVMILENMVCHFKLFPFLLCASHVCICHCRGILSFWLCSFVSFAIFISQELTNPCFVAKAVIRAL